MPPPVGCSLALHGATLQSITTASCDAVPPLALGPPRRAVPPVKVEVEAELHGILASFDTSIINTLAANDVRSLEDLKLLSVDDLKELGFRVGVRNRLLKTIEDAVPHFQIGSPPPLPPNDTLPHSQASSARPHSQVSSSGPLRIAPVHPIVSIQGGDTRLAPRSSRHQSSSRRSARDLSSHNHSLRSTPRGAIPQPLQAVAPPARTAPVLSVRTPQPLTTAGPTATGISASSLMKE